VDINYDISLMLGEFIATYNRVQPLFARVDYWRWLLELLAGIVGAHV
jgi:hypothetical protein